MSSTRYGIVIQYAECSRVQQLCLCPPGCAIVYTRTWPMFYGQHVAHDVYVLRYDFGVYDWHAAL